MASVLTPASDEGQFCDTEVTLEDQKKINRFARLNVKDEELETMLKSLKRQLENIEEASNELMLADEDDLEDDDDLGGDSKDTTARAASNIHFRIGESYVAVNKDEAETLLEEKRKELQVEINDLQSRIDPMKEEMSNIKANLYAKFGNNINLDNEEEK